MKNENREKCKNCGKALRPLNPPVEEYLQSKFCLNVFGWKLMLIKDNIEYGCPDCIADERQSRQIEMGNLIPND